METSVSTFFITSVITYEVVVLRTTSTKNRNKTTELVLVDYQKWQMVQ